ncbi:beta-N-acetylhexosaminidase [Akkermansiaceae bacterium]|nr:beta-N-acetylhexosaminidase [Akkermansiaceae bacterium]MDB4546667.1 beta-N-acetylhexosaminidase [Akkermansiaceae bacterium]MDB4724969.1 beta-N-acetylhexosaminidase [Akkermansiaceae bacterium]
MSAQCLIVGLQGLELSSEEKALFRDLQPAGYILFSRNLESAPQIRALTDSLRALTLEPPFISIDQEGGRVWRTREFSAAPPDAATFSAKADMKQVARFGALTGQLLEILGINLNFAPVLDLDHFPEQNNGLRGRCWGNESQRVIDYAGTFNRWMRKQDVLSCGKHFPTNGLALSDPHHELPVANISLEDLLKEDLLPYTALMPELDAIMACHLNFPQLDPELPASLSPRILTGLLRDQLGYEGLILTDDLDMGAIVNHYGRGNDLRLAMEAGVDIPLVCHEMGTLKDAVKELEKLPHGRVDDSLKRIEKARRRIKTPPAFTIERWDSINKKTRELTHEVVGTDRFDPARPSQSPVEDY